MRRSGLPQEGLKLVACMTMLLDHIAVVVVMDCFEKATGTSREILLDLYEILRTIGRLAFPVYCFLLVEGHVHSRNPKRYGLRLSVGAILSEIPFDLAVFGVITLQHQSVMVTLLLGFLMLEAMKRSQHTFLSILTVVPFAFLAELLHTDYGADGILTIAMFYLTRGLPHRLLLQIFGLWCIFSPSHMMMLNWLGGFAVTMREWAVLAMLPIALYDGHKATKSKAVQWAFYAFYPVHLLVLYLIGRF